MSQCQDISRKSFKNISIICHPNCNTSHMHLRLSSTVLKRKPPSLLTFLQSCHPMKSRRYNKSSEAFFIMPVQSTSQVLSSIAIKQSKGTTNTMEKAKQVLDYLATYPDATIHFQALDMIMHVHSDASFLSRSNARSRACGHFFMGWSPKDGDPIHLNSAFFTLCAIPHFVVASLAEAKLGALFLNCKEGMIFRLTLKELGHPQPKNPIHCNNATAVDIANNTIKRQCSRSMEMQYFWVYDKVAQDAYDVRWHPGQKKLADYQSKHHPGAHHTAVRPWYLHEVNSPLVLPP
jgi:hypothetical protein